jgi:hypothetical protein
LPHSHCGIPNKTPTPGGFVNVTTLRFFLIT